jgi:hypothetical protein
MVTCLSLKPIHKNQGEEMKFNFDFSKCDRIFDELLKFDYICNGTVQIIRAQVQKQSPK